MTHNIFDLPSNYLTKSMTVYTLSRLCVKLCSYEQKFNQQHCDMFLSIWWRETSHLNSPRAFHHDYFTKQWKHQMIKQLVSTTEEHGDQLYAAYMTNSRLTVNQVSMEQSVHSFESFHFTSDSVTVVFSQLTVPLSALRGLSKPLSKCCDLGMCWQWFTVCYWWHNYRSHQSGFLPICQNQIQALFKDHTKDI